MRSKKHEKQLSLFTPIFPGLVPAKDQQDIMQYPFFSLSKKKRCTPITFEDKNKGISIKVLGTQERGIANIFDLDVLIFIASHLMAAKNRGQDTSPEIQVSKYQLLEFVEKGTSGREYQNLRSALDRLQETSVETTIRQGDRKTRWKFSWISDWTEVADAYGRVQGIRFRLNDWIYKGIVEENLILTIDRNYFHLDEGLERFLYRIARKIAGNKRELLMKMSTLRKRSGLTLKPGKFSKRIKETIAKGRIPEYHFEVIEVDLTRNGQMVKEEWIFASKEPWRIDKIRQYIFGQEMELNKLTSRLVTNREGYGF